MPARLESRGNGSFVLCGSLDFDSVSALWEEAEARFPKEPPERIDLGDVERSDSSGVALLVDWLSQVRAQGRDLRFDNIPQQMQAIIRVADLEELLPVD
jgi:phospholipid transport system transporter-binding protein